VAVAVGAASIARGAAQYLGVLLPLPEPVLVSAVILTFTVIAVIGVRESVGVAALMGLIEITGLIVAIIAGFLAAPDLDPRRLLPPSLASWGGVLAGAFLSFFAFIGFETLVNLAEEVRDPARTLPRGIVGAVAASVALYVAVACAVVLSGKIGDHPLVMLFPGLGATAFAAIGAIAVSNGVLVQIVLLARLFYGMADKGQLPAALATINGRTRTPVLSTLLGSLIILVMALVVPFDRLLVATNLITLSVFALVTLALWRVKRRDGVAEPAGFRVPSWVPPIAAIACVALMAGHLLP
jgi:amino acid transporter